MLIITAIIPENTASINIPPKKSEKKNAAKKLLIVSAAFDSYAV